MKTAFRLALALIVPFAFATILVATTPEKRSPSFSTEVSVQSGGTAESYVVKVRVKDLQAGEVVAGASLKTAPGRPVSAESIPEGSDMVVAMSALVEGPHKIAYTVSVKIGGKVVSEHLGNIQL